MTVSTISVVVGAKLRKKDLSVVFIADSQVSLAKSSAPRM